MRRIAPLLLALASACATDRAPTTAESDVVLDEVGIELSAPSLSTLVPLSTYDGSNQVVHPDVAVPGAGWSDRLVHLAATPYPNGESAFENPSLWSGPDGVGFAPVAGAPSPLVRPTYGHLSDPDLLYDPSNKELRLYYRQSVGTDHLWMLTSRDARHWSDPVAVLDAAGSAALSPAVVRRARDSWWMWTVNAESGCAGTSARVQLRRSRDGVTWDPPSDIAMRLPSGLSPWHIDVQWVSSRHEYWAVFPVKTAGSCLPTAIYMASSPDGLNWTVAPTPLIVAGETDELRDIVYRSTFLYHPTTDAITFWYSGARLTNGVARWHVVVQQRARAQVFSAAATTNALVVPRPDRALAATFDPP